MDCAAYFTSGFNSPLDKLAEITVKLVLVPRCVTGIPAKAGTAIELEIPGTTVVSIPYFSTNSNSSYPLPKTKESPPFKRTTLPCEKAYFTNNKLISSCEYALKPLRFPTKIFVAIGAKSNNSSFTNASYKITSACLMAFKPFRVINSKSPGPAPTSVTFGVVLRFFIFFKFLIDFKLPSLRRDRGR